MAGGLFVNILIIITPVFFYQIFLLDRVRGGKTTRLSEWVFGLMSGMASILCMGFPIVAGDGFIWDLRWIP
ncbi:MAG: sensor histidine kinase, partial [Tumebacillaceae bacterium]